MTGLVCLKCGTGEHVAAVASVPWCHNCYYDAHPAERPADQLASLRAWRRCALLGRPAPVEPAAVVQTMGMLLRMRR
ncbi:MAG: hypothetical protein ACRDZ3_16500 [Acidimicrobiia bacterium]